MSSSPSPRFVAIVNNLDLLFGSNKTNKGNLIEDYDKRDELQEVAKNFSNIPLIVLGLVCKDGVKGRA